MWSLSEVLHESQCTLCNCLLHVTAAVHVYAAAQVHVYAAAQLYHAQQPQAVPGMQRLQKGCLLRNSLEHLLGAHQAINLHTPPHIVKHQQVHKLCLQLSYNHSSCNLSGQKKCMGRFETDTASCNSIEANDQSARTLRHTVRENPP